jgi:septal ring factor EnvC (AmiA/AmiB activator)
MYNPRMFRSLAFLLFFPLGAFLSIHAFSPAYAATEESLRETLKQEESKARSRQDSLKRLTGEERQLDKNLAEAEEGILALENSLAEYRARLASLAAAGESLQRDYDRLILEQQKTEKALQELLATLWGLHTRRVSMGGRDLEHWPVIDREYYWTADLLKAIENYQEDLYGQERDIAEVISRREAIGQEVSGHMSLIDQQKTRILSDRLKYEQRLAEVRRQRQSTETELNAALKLMEDLNFDLKRLRDASVSIDKAKGSLFWPTTGRLVKKFNPSSPPPASGLGFSTAENADVRAVHAGKVMFRDTMRGLGLVVVLQHGQEYYSVYAFLSDCSVSLGQNVSRGQILGRSGYYPAIRGNGMYFELRHRQVAVNPESWLEKK